MKISCGIIVEYDDKWLICHPSHSKYWDFPKGKQEENETPLVTALRETKEETGLDFSDHVFDLIDLGDHPYNREKRLHLFKIILQDPPNITDMRCSTYVDIKIRGKIKNVPEMDAYKLLPINQAYNKLSPVMKRWIDRNYPLTLS